MGDKYISILKDIKTKDDLDQIFKIDNILYDLGKIYSKKEIKTILYKMLHNVNKTELIEHISKEYNIQTRLFKEQYNKRFGQYCEKTWISEDNNAYKLHYQHVKEIFAKKYVKETFKQELDETKYLYVFGAPSDVDAHDKFKVNILNPYILSFWK